MKALRNRLRRRWRSGLAAALLVALLTGTVLALAGSLASTYASTSTVTLVPRLVQGEMYGASTEAAASRIASAISAPQDPSALVAVGERLEPPQTAEDLAPFVTLTRVSGSTTVLVTVTTTSAALTERITEELVPLLAERAEAAARLLDGQPDVTVSTVVGATREVRPSLALGVSAVGLLAVLSGLLTVFVRDGLDRVVRDAAAVRDRYGLTPASAATVVDADSEASLFQAALALRDELDVGSEASPTPRLVTVSGVGDEGTLATLQRAFAAGSGRLAVVAPRPDAASVSTHDLARGVPAGDGEGGALRVDHDVARDAEVDPAWLRRVLAALGASADVVLVDTRAWGTAARGVAESRADARVAVVAAGRTTWDEMPPVSREAGGTPTLVVVTDR